MSTFSVWDVHTTHTDLPKRHTHQRRIAGRRPVGGQKADGVVGEERAREVRAVDERVVRAGLVHDHKVLVLRRGVIGRGSEKPNSRLRIRLGISLFELWGTTYLGPVLPHRSGAQVRKVRRELGGAVLGAGRPCFLLTYM